MRKRFLALLLTLLLTTSAVPTCTVTAFAEAISENVVYLNPGETKTDDPVWYVWTWSTGDGIWVKGESEGELYKFSGVDSNIVFVRMNPEGNVPSWDNGTKWNQTGNLTLNSKRLYTITGWKNGDNGNLGGEWSDYVEETTTEETTSEETASETQAQTAAPTAAPTSTQPPEQAEKKTLWLNAAAVSSGEEVWYAYSWAGDRNTWVKGVSDGSFLKFNNVYSDIIFLRFKNTVTAPDWNSPDLWNRTGDLNCSENDLFTITIWHGDKYGNMCGKWSNKSDVKPEGAHGDKDFYFNTGNTDPSYSKWYVWTWADGDNGYWVNAEPAGQYMLARGVCKNLIILCASSDYFAPMWDEPVKKFQSNDITLDDELFVIYSFSGTVSGYWTSFSDFENPQIDENDNVKYSDIFYRYSDYLNNEFLNNYTDYAFNMMDRVEAGFAGSGDYYMMQLKTAINSAISLEDWAKLISDASGKTNFQYEKSLDAANVKLVNQIVGAKNAVYSGAVTEYGNTKKMTTYITSAFGIINGIYETILKDMEYEQFDIELEGTLSEIIDYVCDNGSMHHVKQRLVINKKSFLEETNLSKIKSNLKIAGNAFEFAKAFVLALAMENMRMEVIDDIIANTSDSSFINQGMRRLKTQLDKNFFSYFFYNYIEQKVLDKVFDIVKDAAVNQILGEGPTLGIVKGCISLTSTLVFDVALDIPDLDDYTTQMVLTEYCCDLEYAIRGIANKDFRQSFQSLKIKEFETLCGAYSACVRASLDNCGGLANSSNRADLKAAQTYFDTVDFYTEYINSTKNIIQCTPKPFRFPTFTGDWYTSPSGLDTLAQAADDIVYDNKVIYSGINGTILVEGNLYVAWQQNFTMDGNIRNSSGGKIINYGGLTVWGDIDMAGYDVENRGTIDVWGDCYADVTMPEEYSLLKVQGSLVSHSDMANGKVLVNGQTKAQYVEIKSVKNFEADSANGIEAHIKVWGELKLNRTGLLSTSLFRFCTTTKLMDGEERYYGNIALAEPYTLTRNLNANIIASTYNSENTLKIEQGSDVTLNGSITAVYSESRYDKNLYVFDEEGHVGHRYETDIANGLLKIENSGKFRITGKIDNSYVSVINDGEIEAVDVIARVICMNSADSKLNVKGNMDIVYSSNSNINGTLTLSGSGAQYIHGVLSADKIILTNSSAGGVNFTSPLNVGTLFNHNYNNFTLYSDGNSSTFPDYDGDSMADNKDPYPTDKNNLKGQAGTVYFIAPENWSIANCYIWNSKYGGAPYKWAGKAMTPIKKVLNGRQLYSMSFDTNAFDNVIFTDGSQQTADLKTRNGKTFDPKKKLWLTASFTPFFTVEGTDYSQSGFELIGTFNDWKADSKMKSVFGNVSECETELKEGSYEFKLKYDNTYYGCNRTASSGQELTLDTSARNCVLNIFEDGKYRFSFDSSSSKLTITQVSKKKGDSNMDGEFNIKDVTEIQKQLAMLDYFTEEQNLNADYDGDGKVTLRDATTMQLSLAGLLTPATGDELQTE